MDRIGGAGGGERFAREVATRLDRARFESILCVSRPSERRALDAVRETGTRVLELDRRSRASLTPWLRFADFLRRERVDVLHSHKHGSNVWGALVAGRGRVPVFLAHEHSWAFAGDRGRLLLGRHLVPRRATAILAVSELDRRRIVELYRVDPERVFLQPNGVPRVRLPDPGMLRRELGCDDSTPIVGIVARLTPEKRIDVLLDALAQLRAAGIRVHGVVLGDGPEEPRLRRQAAALGIARDVSFLGRRDQPLELAIDFDVAVLCSDREGCPLALLEYMALARPTVATRVGGVPDVVRDGREALLVEPGDSTSLAQAIERLLSTPGLAGMLATAAAKRQSSEFELDAVVRRLEGLYERLLGAVATPAFVTPSPPPSSHASAAHGSR